MVCKGVERMENVINNDQYTYYDLSSQGFDWARFKNNSGAERICNEIENNGILAAMNECLLRYNLEFVKKNKELGIVAFHNNEDYLGVFINICIAPLKSMYKENNHIKLNVLSKQDEERLALLLQKFSISTIFSQEDFLEDLDKIFTLSNAEMFLTKYATSRAVRISKERIIGRKTLLR